jgi:hypothetical protein
MLFSALCALAILAVIFGLSIYSRRRAAALLEDSNHGDAMGSDRVSFSDYYRPMSRILSAGEFESVRLLSGLNQADVARFRASRTTAFRSYLNEMRLDFNRMEFKLRYLMLAASEDEAELVVRLNRLKSRFQLQLYRVEFQLFLFRFGWTALDVTSLVETLAELESSLMGNPSAISAAA